MMGQYIIFLAFFVESFRVSSNLTVFQVCITKFVGRFQSISSHRVIILLERACFHNRIGRN